MKLEEQGYPRFAEWYMEDRYSIACILRPETSIYNSSVQLKYHKSKIKAPVPKAETLPITDATFITTEYQYSCYYHYHYHYDTFKACSAAVQKD